ncbi:unnamed protein product [Gongylonema pulchrum]|uniref:RING-type E3 ubiquitin transferase n=1 Tax=Gongylonema pulchrum TaxID=637853 RepID=A0A183DXL1_9BILA|nr:unnamed protein product [Gongylonema pulchrum]
MGEEEVSDDDEQETAAAAQREQGQREDKSSAPGPTEGSNTAPDELLSEGRRNATLHGRRMCAPGRRASVPLNLAERKLRRKLSTFGRDGYDAPHYVRTWSST